MSEKEMNDYWNTLMEKCVKDERYQDISQSLKWLERSMKENVPFGKKVRALTFLQMYREMVPVRTTQQDEISYIVAWCNEIMQAAYLVADDIMDDSETRRGNPCWFRYPDVGMMAINDSLMLENLVYELIGRFVEDDKLKLQLIQNFLNTSYRTILGQCLDTFVSMQKDYGTFTNEIYSAIVKYKTSYYTIYQPIALAIILAGKANPTVLKKVEEVCLELGHFFQAQDDFIDCYSDPELSGKIGTDIIDAKCSWLAVAALKTANPIQKATFLKHYGLKDAASEKIIKELYNEMKLKDQYDEFQAKYYENIKKLIDGLPEGIPTRSFVDLLNKLYKRDK